MDAERSLRHPSESSYRVRPNRRSPLPRLDWLLIVVGLCWLSWPVPAEAQQACVHSLCEIGGKLNPTCDPCVDAICGLPNDDPYCCTVEWDDACIDQVLPVCGDPTCAQVCAHSPCEIGGPLDSTCNECTALVCFQDPGCCTDDGDPSTDEWGAPCVARVEQECGVQCEPGANLCSNALPIHAGTVFGTLLGASNDGCESGNNSCRSADVWYMYTQGTADDMVLSTCSTQRSFGIDTVLSVHTECPGSPNNEIISNDDAVVGLVPQACINDPAPVNVDSALPLGGAYALDPGETAVIRVAHHDDSVRNNFELRVLAPPEPCPECSIDNCLDVHNPDQDDTDSDDCGNLCDADYDNNGIVGFPDFGQFVTAFGTGDTEKCHVEPISGCTVGFPDFGFLVSSFGMAPGPSGTTSGTMACP
jgi:hypothetical protein